MIRVTLFLRQPKRVEKGHFKEEEREIELAVPRKQRNKEKSDWQDGESETGPEEQPRLKQRSKERQDGK